MRLFECAATLPAGDVALGASLAYGERGVVTVARLTPRRVRRVSRSASPPRAAARAAAAAAPEGSHSGGGGAAAAATRARSPWALSEEAACPLRAGDLLFAVNNVCVLGQPLREVGGALQLLLQRAAAAVTVSCDSCCL